MHAIELVFAIGWVLFWVYWLVAAFTMKRERVPWSRELRIRALIIVVVLVLFRLGAFRDASLSTDPWRAGIGLFLFVLGLGFAVWARVNIGRNWGTPMSQKAEPELVTSGPYRLTRHPIYSGILLGTIGTSVALSWFLVDRYGLGRGLFHLRRDRRGALSGRPVSRHLPDLQAFDENARALRLLSDSGRLRTVC